jgi:hypothetical protein
MVGRQQKVCPTRRLDFIGFCLQFADRVFEIRRVAQRKFSVVLSGAFDVLAGKSNRLPSNIANAPY